MKRCASLPFPWSSGSFSGYIWTDDSDSQFRVEKPAGILNNMVEWSDDPRGSSHGLCYRANDLPIKIFFDGTIVRMGYRA